MRAPDVAAGCRSDAGSPRHRGAVVARGPGWCRRSAFADDETAERYAERMPGDPAGERQRDRALGHDLRLGRIVSAAGIGFGRCIATNEVVDVVHGRKLAGAVLDLRMAEGQAAALGFDVDRQLLAVAAGDRALAGGMLVEGATAGHVVMQAAAGLASPGRHERGRG